MSSEAQVIIILSFQFPSSHTLYASKMILLKLHFHVVSFFTQEPQQIIPIRAVMLQVLHYLVLHA